MKLVTVALALVVAAVTGLAFLFAAQEAVLRESESKMSAAPPSYALRNAKTTADPRGEVLLPTMSFSLAAVVRRQPSRKQPQQQRYALVHEKPPRGWWLPGGGIEHKDATPVDAAIRETVEEAGSPSLLPLLSLSQSTRMAKERGPKLRLLPSMTHLISLQQSPGRIRFIFRGEWIDDVGECNNQTTASDDGPKSILKCPPGDEESIESKWLTWDEIQCFEHKKRRKGERSQLPQKASTAACMSDPWLRGHEPLEFYGMLERSWKENESVPGLPVHMMDFSEENNEKREEGVIGAFFGHMERSSNESNRSGGLSHHGRAALLVHLKCCLVLYDDDQKRIALDANTRRLPSSHVKNQNYMTLKELVRGMVADLVSFPSDDGSENKGHGQIGLLRVEHVVHGNGREATLTVFPIVCLSSADGLLPSEIANKTMNWVEGEEIGDDSERKLVKAAIADRSGGDTICSLNILRDGEGPL